MLCAVTIRSIKPGTFESFRAAWEPRPWPPELRRVFLSRNEQDPDQVLTASFLDVASEQFDALRDNSAILGAEGERLSRIAEFEETLVYKGLFEVVEEITAPANAE
jgi:hypothetical protein